LDETASAITDSGDRQVEATGEISRHVRSAADSTRAAGDSMSQVAEAVGRTNEMTREVVGTADGLLRHSANLDSKIDQFLQKSALSEIRRRLGRPLTVACWYNPSWQNRNFLHKMSWISQDRGV
jgi:methyl-accepting chemotaxis protein